MVYYESKTIRRDGDRVTLWQLTDYKWMQGNAPFEAFMMGPHRFLSTKTQKEFDCARNSVRLLASSNFLGRLGTGIQNAVAVGKATDSPGTRQHQPGVMGSGLWVTTTPREPRQYSSRFTCSIR